MGPEALHLRQSMESLGDDNLLSALLFGYTLLAYFR